MADAVESAGDGYILLLERYQPFRVLWGYRQHVVIGGHGMEHCEPLAL